MKNIDRISHVIIHEFVHYHQFETKKLIVENGVYFWRGQRIINEGKQINLSQYHSLPWEQNAEFLADKLYRKFLSVAKYY